MGWDASWILETVPSAGAIAPDLREILDSVRILSPSHYQVCGLERRLAAGWPPSFPGAGRPDGLPPRTGASGPAAALERRASPSDLAESLTGDLYHYLFCRRQVRPIRQITATTRREHTEGLSAANRGGGTWMPGFRVLDLDGDGDATVENGSVIFRVAARDLRLGVGKPGRGELCRVRVPREMRHLNPGYYVALGDADEAPPDPRSHLIRLYWHLKPETAGTWMRLLTEGLNRRAIPFRLKAPNHPRDYRRADAGVLYLGPEPYTAARGVLAGIHRAVAGGLHPEVPRLTLALAPGLGLAEGRGDRTSFGEHRCRLIAVALAESFARGERDEALRTAVASAFRGAGLDPLRPHLAPGSDRNYALPQAMSALPRDDRPPADSDDHAIFRRAARVLGQTLCRQAYWLRDRCNWTGTFATEHPSDPRRQRSVLRALDAGLYRGTAGVGLFLAELSAATGDDASRRTALGASRQSLASADAEPARYPAMGFYSGRLGIAWAARRTATLTGCDELASRSRELLDGLLDDLAGERLLDLIHGNAGAILALLALHRENKSSRFLDTALTLGEEILRAADRRGKIWSWPNRQACGFATEAPPLTGFSHGAAGIGLALLELHDATGRPELLAAGRGAFAYEDTLFDAELGGWADVRGAGDAGRTPETKVASAWCHGAPGIALSRLRAMALDVEQAGRHERSARAGLSATRETIRRRMARGDADASLCHGLCGLVEVLRAGDALMPAGDFVDRVMRRLVARHAEPGDWPSGVYRHRRNPALMLGEAGIGYTLLRLGGASKAPSVLLPGT